MAADDASITPYRELTVHDVAVLDAWERIHRAEKVLREAELGGDTSALLADVREALSGPHLDSMPRTIAVVYRAPNGPDVYWGPFRDGDAVRAWAAKYPHALRHVGWFEVKDPESNPREWWL